MEHEPLTSVFAIIQIYNINPLKREEIYFWVMCILIAFGFIIVSVKKTAAFGQA